jgi:hypothetical protein
LRVANDEDKALVESLHRGGGLPLLPQGSYQPIERNLLQFVRYLEKPWAACLKQTD